VLKKQKTTQKFLEDFSMSISDASESSSLRMPSETCKSGEPYFKITDNGPGMTYETLKTVLITFGVKTEKPYKQEII
jgi:hypothetical protein